MFLVSPSRSPDYWTCAFTRWPCFVARWKEGAGSSGSGIGFHREILQSSTSLAHYHLELRHYIVSGQFLHAVYMQASLDSVSRHFSTLIRPSWLSRHFITNEILSSGVSVSNPVLSKFDLPAKILLISTDSTTRCSQHNHHFPNTAPVAWSLVDVVIMMPTSIFPVEEHPPPDVRGWRITQTWTLLSS